MTEYKIIGVHRHPVAKRTKYDFVFIGLHCWVEVTDDGKWFNGSFGEGSDHTKNQLDAIAKLNAKSTK